MEILYGKKNEVSFAVSPVVKYRESYIGPYILQGNESEFGRDASIEEEIKNNRDVLGYVIRTKCMQLDETGNFTPVYIDNYVMIGEEKRDLLNNSKTFVLETGDLFHVGDPNSYGNNYGTRVVCCSNRNTLLVSYLKFRHSVFDCLCDGKNTECSKQFVKKN